MDLLPSGPIDGGSRNDKSIVNLTFTHDKSFVNLSFNPTEYRCTVVGHHIRHFDVLNHQYFMLDNKTVIKYSHG